MYEKWGGLKLEFTSVQSVIEGEEQGTQLLNCRSEKVNIQVMLLIFMKLSQSSADDQCMGVL